MSSSDSSHHGAALGTVLLLTADPVRSGRLAQALTSAGLMVTVGFNEAHARSCLADLGIDVMVIDMQMLGDAPQVALRSLTRDSPVPILALLTQEAPRIEQLFAMGISAVAPVDGGPIELGAQVRALLGLGDPIGPLRHRPRTFGALTVDTGRRLLRLHGQPVAVTPIQFRIAGILISAQGDVVSRAALYRLLWQSNVDDEGQRLTAHIHRLRERLGEDPHAPELILTVRGEGYRLAEASTDATPSDPLGVSLMSGGRRLALPVWIRF